MRESARAKPSRALWRTLRAYDVSQGFFCSILSTCHDSAHLLLLLISMLPRTYCLCMSRARVKMVLQHANRASWTSWDNACMHTHGRPTELLPRSRYSVCALDGPHHPMNHPTEKHHTQRELDFWNSVVFSCSNGRS